ncbi:DoxX family protein [Rubrivirga sp. IMCC45206]|uniref:DoxX family protein n=1 Tax=Rubrivirga sp. IMCC45206 TaxID=3391614 RepID=UPI00398FF7FF
MPSPDPMTLRTALFSVPDTSHPVDLGLLALRVGAGLLLAFAHGLGKLPPSEGFISGTAEMGFPLPALFAWAAGLSEFVGGLLLAVGLATRPAAVFVAITMAVAFFGQHGASVGEGEKALIFLVIVVALGFAGPGRYSLDHAIARRSRTVRGRR